MPKRKKIVKKRKVPKKQKGGAKKKTTHCVCSKKHHQMGGKFLSPAQMKMLTRPVRRFSTLPVNPKLRQQGMGHCGCQYGGDFLGIGKAFKKIGKSIVSNPLRLALGIGSLGLSETFLQPLDLLKSKTGLKGSKILDVAAPVLSAVGGPELALGSKLTSKALKQMGLGYQPMLK